MSYLYTDEQRQMGEAARRLLAGRYSGAALKSLIEAQGRYDEAYWSACRKMGWTAMALPEAYGGLGLGLIDLCIVAEASGRFVCGAPFLVSSYAAGEAVLQSGDAGLRREILPSLASGEKIGT